MKIDQAKNGNWNYMHEWRKSDSESEWFPCHLINDEDVPYKNYMCIFTRNGSIVHILSENVRKMSEEDYIKYREKCISHLGEYYKTHGFHETCEEDLNLLRKM